MHADDIFWAIIWAVTGLTITATTYIGTNYWKEYNIRVVELIQEGVSPVAATCALQDDYGKTPVCIILAVDQVK